MFPDFFGAVGLAGWLLVLLSWAGLIMVVVWCVTRLFPDRPTRSSDRVDRNSLVRDRDDTTAGR